MAKEITTYIIDACGLIAYFRDEDGADKLETLFLKDANKFFIHSINFGEVYYDTLRYSGKEKANQLFANIAELPINIIWTIDPFFIQLVGKYKTSYKISYADSFVLALAEKENATVITTDHNEFDSIENNEILAFYWLR